MAWLRPLVLRENEVPVVSTTRILVELSGFQRKIFKSRVLLQSDLVVFLLAIHQGLQDRLGDGDAFLIF